MWYNRVMFIIAQIFGLVCLVSYILSTQTNKRKTFMKYRIVSDISSGLQYLFLGAMAGFAINIVATIRNLLISKHTRENISTRNIVLILVLTIGFGFLFYDGAVSLLVIVYSCITSIFLAQKNMTIYRVSQILSSPLIIFYNIFTGAYVGLAVAVLQVVFVSIGVHKFDHKKIQRYAKKQKRTFKKLKNKI